jgi:hypothetical protein
MWVVGLFSCSIPASSCLPARAHRPLPPIILFFPLVFILPSFKHVYNSRCPPHIKALIRSLSIASLSLFRRLPGALSILFLMLDQKLSRFNCRFLVTRLYIHHRVSLFCVLCCRQWDGTCALPLPSVRINSSICVSIQLRN